MTTRVLVINSGSSSLKYGLVDAVTGDSIAAGLVERIGAPGSGVSNHEEAVHRALEELSADGHDIGPQGEITVVGHRVVHGGDRFQEPTLLTEEVIATIRELIPLAPLHNPANLAGVLALQRLRPDVPHVAVFDTAFHQTIPDRAATYAIARDVAERHQIRRYGFHGTSFSWVSRQAAESLGRRLEDLALIVLHLGNGASAAAILGGRCLDTSMGLTPLEGLVMGSRSGSLDPAIPFHLHRAAGLSYDEIERLLTHDSGLKGLCGDNDMREVVQRAEAGDAAATLALDVYCYRIRTYVGAYYAALGRLDAVVFTAGVGENSTPVRARSLEGLEALGIAVDPELNAAPAGAARRISPAASPVEVLVVPTNEEAEIARQAFAVAAGLG